MKRFYFKKGLIFVDLNTRWQLNKRLVNNKLQFESEEGEISNLTDNQILANWQSGKWQVDETSLGIPGDTIYQITPADLASYPLKWQASAKRKLHYIHAVNPEDNKYNFLLWQSLIQEAAKAIDDKHPPCTTTVHLWWKRYHVTKSINNLLPKKMNGVSRKEDPRYTIFEDVIQTAFLNSQRVPILDVARKVRQRITLLNVGRDQSQIIKQVSLPTIYRWVNNLRGDIRDSSRLGAEFARNKYRNVMGGLKVNAILERVEIDHTPLDLMIIDKNTNLPLGRVWVTMAIDKYSRMVVGFYISFNPPSSYSVLQCIKMMILTKEELIQRFPDIKNEWPAYGVPDLLAIDNGMDLHADALKEACLDLGIQMLYCPAATPEMKGSIERFFRTINQDFIHTLPGTTFSNIDERGDYASEEMATIDLETLVHLMMKWIVDVYNVTPHRGIGDTPLNKWIESAKHRKIELPICPESLSIIAGVPAKRTVFHYGIELDGLHYNNRMLQELRKISGKNLQVQLKFYEDHVRFIDVLNPMTKEYIRIEAVNEDYTKDLHREAHRLSRVQARKKFGEQYSMPQLMEARMEIENIVKEALKAKKMRQRKLSANLLMHDSTAVFNAQNPIDDVHKKPIKRSIQKAPDPLESGLDDPLPDVKGDPSGQEDEDQS